MPDGLAGGLENVDIYTHENLAEVLIQKFGDLSAYSKSKTHGDAYFEWLASFGLVQGCQQHTTHSICIHDSWHGYTPHKVHHVARQRPITKVAELYHSLKLQAVDSMVPRLSHQLISGFIENVCVHLISLCT